MISDELCFLSVADAARRIRDRSLSRVALTEAYLERVAAIDGQLSSYITVTGDLARVQASAAEGEIANGNYRGPLRGVPFGLKDMIDTRGILTTAHSKGLAYNILTQDAGVVTRLYEAGPILLGKQALYERPVALHSICR